MVQFTLSDELKQALVQVRRNVTDSPSISCLLDLICYLFRCSIFLTESATRSPCVGIRRVSEGLEAAYWEAHR
jgi:hypothetical protein